MIKKAVLAAILVVQTLSIRLRLGDSDSALNNALE